MTKVIIILYLGLFAAWWCATNEMEPYSVFYVVVTLIAVDWSLMRSKTNG